VANSACHRGLLGTCHKAGLIAKNWHAVFSSLAELSTTNGLKNLCDFDQGAPDRYLEAHPAGSQSGPIQGAEKSIATDLISGRDRTAD